MDIVVSGFKGWKPLGIYSPHLDYLSDILQYHSDLSKVPGLHEKIEIIPKLTGHKHIMSPSECQLLHMPPEKHLDVLGFKVEHEDFGQVEWDNPVDICHANHDTIILFSRHHVIV